MSESQALTVPQGLVGKALYAGDTFNDVAKAGKFFNFITIVQKPRSDGIQLGHFVLQKGIGGRNVLDLSTEFNCTVHSWRPKCTFINQTTGAVMSWYDPKTQKDKFLQAEIEQAKKGMTGWLYGPEFFIYLPEYNEFATFFFSNLTLRNEAANMKTLIGRTATCKTVLIKTQFTWYGAVCVPCQVELPRPENYESWETECGALLSSMPNNKIQVAQRAYRT